MLTCSETRDNNSGATWSNKQGSQILFLLEYIRTSDNLASHLAANSSLSARNHNVMLLTYTDYVARAAAGVRTKSQHDWARCMKTASADWKRGPAKRWCRALCVTLKYYEYYNCVFCLGRCPPSAAAHLRRVCSASVEHDVRWTTTTSTTWRYTGNVISLSASPNRRILTNQTNFVLFLISIWRFVWFCNINKFYWVV